MRGLLCLLALLVVVSLASAGSTASLSSAGLVINGVAIDDYSGSFVSSGDVNGDLIDDVIIGAYNRGSGAGVTYVVFGGAAKTGVIELSSSADLTISGVAAGDQSGFSVSSGDVNGDGKDDVIIGAWGADPDGKTDAGATYVVFGGRTGAISLSTANLIIKGVALGDLSGRSVSSGDVNGDGKDDVIIGAWNAKPGAVSKAGVTYVVFGGRTGVIELSTANLIINGVAAYDYSGRFVSSGDVNGDGKDDVIIGAFGADPGGNSYAGATYVVFGGRTGVIELSSADLTLNGVAADDQSGSFVSSGDVNGDGKDDVIIGAWNANSYAGVTYVVFGGRTGAILLSTADLIINGVAAYDYSGYFVSSGNVNSDGKDDVIIGAPGAASSAGKTYVVFGGRTGVIALSTADLTISGVAAGDQSGSSVSSGNVNHDGYDDIIIGANGADPSGVSNAGKTYVVFGAPPLSLSPSLSGLGSGGKVVAGRAFSVSGGVSCAGGSCGVVSLALDPVLHRAFGGWLQEPF